MKKLYCVFGAGMMMALPVMAETNFKIGEPFDMKGEITHFYGRDKSAEAILWSNALSVCAKLDEGRNQGLLLNRLSEVSIATVGSTSVAQAKFICVYVGNGD